MFSGNWEVLSYALKLLSILNQWIMPVLGLSWNDLFNDWVIANILTLFISTRMCCEDLDVDVLEGVKCCIWIEEMPAKIYMLIMERSADEELRKRKIIYAVIGGF